MNILGELQRRFAGSLTNRSAQVSDLVAMLRPAQDAKFGDYQANFAMTLAKQLGRPPRDVAAEIVAETQLDDFCQPPEIAGPGFINLRLRDDWLASRLNEVVRDERLGVPYSEHRRSFVIDYSAPNVAKPMHVGHIRSTVIGNAIERILRFLGHQVISDNHLGDWGTQFGMVIYGYKHFVDAQKYQQQPVDELSRLYRLVNTLIDVLDCQQRLPAARQLVEQRRNLLEVLRRETPPAGDKSAEKKHLANVRKAERQLEESQDELQTLITKATLPDRDTAIAQGIAAHPDIAQAVLLETAKLHAGDPENKRLWDEFMPLCRDAIHRVYKRLDVEFMHELGESFYHDRLSSVVEELKASGLATESDGATCVFLDGFDAPMIIRKRDGAFLYATTDLATIRYRMEQWRPEAILYVVDHRQSDHFNKLFATARRWGYQDIELTHVSFGTVLGPDGKPYKTRAGDTVGLESLLDEGVRKALAVLAANDDAKPNGREFTDEERVKIAEVIGIAALKYADLSQNRTTDYVFSYDKMLALDGNTAAYMQYSYARVQGILRRAQVDTQKLLQSSHPVVISHPAERSLGLMLLRFSEALEEARQDYRPNQFTVYLYELTKAFSVFFEACPVLRAETEELRWSRLALVDLTGRVVRLGLSLLGINVVDRM
jgi:arginyl-tRNA synthetase